MDIEVRIQELERRLHQLEAQNCVLAKAFRIIGGSGDYFEFGSYTGGTLITAYRRMKEIIDEFQAGLWDHAKGPGGGGNIIGYWTRGEQ